VTAELAPPNHQPHRPDPQVPKSIQAIATSVELTPGELLCRRGDEATHLYVVSSGLLLSTGSQGPELAVTGILFPGEATFADFSSPAYRADSTVTAVTVATALSLSHDAVEHLFAHDPLARRWLLGAVARQVRKAQYRGRALVFQQVHERIAALLCQIVRATGTASLANGRGARGGLTQAEMARIVGADRATVNRTLSALNRRGIVRVTPTQIVIRDMVALEEMAQVETEPHAGAASGY
jgi:CRP-like cAMP-binding protein